MKKNNNKGFTLMEMLIVVAIIAVLVAIAIPVFTNQLEKAREATDMANIRSAYAEVMACALTNASQKDANQNKVKLDDSKAGEYTYTKFVKRVQKQDGWQGTDPSATASDGIGGIKAGLTVTKDNIGWTVTYSEKDGTVSFKEVQTDPTGLNG